MSEQTRKTTVLGPDCRIKGEVTLDNDAIVMGRFDGTLRISGVLEITESAEVTGTIIAGMLRLAGRAEANVIAEGGAELLPGAELIGQVFTSNLQIVEGAVFQGEVIVGPDAVANAESVQQQPERKVRTTGSNVGGGIRKPQLAANDYEDAQQEREVQTVPGAMNGVLQRRRTKVLSNRRDDDSADAA